MLQNREADAVMGDVLTRLAAMPIPQSLKETIYEMVTEQADGAGSDDDYANCVAIGITSALNRIN